MFAGAGRGAAQERLEAPVGDERRENRQEPEWDADGEVMVGGGGVVADVLEAEELERLVAEDDIEVGDVRRCERAEVPQFVLAIFRRVEVDAAHWIGLGVVPAPAAADADRIAAGGEVAEGPKRDRGEKAGRGEGGGDDATRGAHGG